MPANKMPEMPIPAVEILEWKENASPRLRFNAHVCELAAPAGLYTADQMRAMWLAGIADARACVPGAAEQVIGPMFCAGFNECRKATLANLTALEQEAKK